MKTKSKSKVTAHFKKGDVVQFTNDAGDIEKVTVVEGPYQFAFEKNKDSDAYSVLHERGSIKILQAEYMSLAPKVSTLLEAIEAFLCHHRVSELELNNTSDTLQDRFAELRAAVNLAKEVK